MPEQAMIDAAKAPFLAYNKKDWNAVRTSVAAGVVYDEVATARKVDGIDQVLGIWQGWATAFPDSQATFHSAFASGDTVVLELTWRGKHTGTLQAPKGPVAATGKSIEIRGCQVVQLSGGKPRLMRQYFDMATMFQQLGITG